MIFPSLEMEVEMMLVSTIQRQQLIEDGVGVEEVPPMKSWTLVAWVRFVMTLDLPCYVEIDLLPKVDAAAVVILQQLIAILHYWEKNLGLVIFVLETACCCCLCSEHSSNCHCYR